MAYDGRPCKFVHNTKDGYLKESKIDQFCLALKIVSVGTILYNADFNNVVMQLMGCL